MVYLYRREKTMNITREELLNAKWIRFEYGKVTRVVMKVKAVPGGLLCFQVTKNGNLSAGYRTFNPAKMVMIQDTPPEVDKLPEEWRKLLNASTAGAI
jgi:hypothetical protein